MPVSISKHITKTAVDRMQHGETLRDTELAGFIVRKRGGKPIYYLNKRIRGGEAVWVKIGTHGEPWTAGNARKKALDYAAMLAKGINPNHHRQLEKSKMTVAVAIENFMAEHVLKLKPRTREEYQRMITNDIIPRLGSRKVDALSREQVARFHISFASTPRKANYALAVLSKFMSWCEDHRLRPENSNPCRYVKKFQERRRERYLTIEEFGKLGEVLEQAESDSTNSPFVIAAIRLLLFTGARRNEILLLKWEHVDIDRKMLRLPDSKTGEKVIRLNEAALAVLASLPRLSSNPYIIAGQRTGQHLVNLQKSWARLRERAGLSDVRLHDLRHSFASIIASGGGSLQKLGSLLGHSNIQTTMRYAHLFDDPVRELNEEAGAAIENAINFRERK